MRLLGEDTDKLNKLIIICLLLIGTCTFNGVVSSDLILAFTSELPNVQAKETTYEASTPGDATVSSESTPSPILPASTASVTENSEIDVTTDSGPSILKESEMTTSFSIAQKTDTSLVDYTSIAPPANAARNAPETNGSVPNTTLSGNNGPLDSAGSEATSTMVIPARPTTDSTKLATGHEAEQTTQGHLTTTKTAKGSEPGDDPESTTATGSPAVTTNLDAITTNFDVTPNLEDVTTNLAEMSPNHANTATSTEVMPSALEETTGLADSNENTPNVTTIHAKEITGPAGRTAKLEEPAITLEDITTDQPKATTTQPEATTTQPEATTTQPEVTTTQTEAATDLAPKAAVTTVFAEIDTDSSEDSPASAPTGPANTSSTRTGKDHQESNDISSATVWFILVLDGNCTHLARGRQGQRESGLKRQIIENLTSWLDAGQEAVTIPAGVVCTPEGRVHANLTLFQNGAANISGRLKSLEDLKGPLFRFHGQEFYVYQILTADGFLNKEPDIPVDLKHTDVELLIYISVGATCAFLFLLAMVLVACKYCTCRDPKPFEFGEPANANLRLEDYTLTRIPRPKVGYVEYCRGLTKRYCPLDDRTSGMVQPFDTSVVPLEDARAQDFHDGVIVRPSDIRWLSGSMARAYHAGCCGGYRPASGYANDADGYCIHSTENLHRAHKVDRYVDKGVDNPNFY